MATLVLTAVGTAIGGPIGGAIGSLFGQAADQRLFAPRGRTGARVTDLRLQTSSYGTPIARIIGAMRVAGTIIWATDLVEHRHRSGAKGRAGTTSYTYSASFAVALSSRRVAGLGRIWAEGNILRGAAGDWKTPVTMRFHNGDADQNVDPLIAAAEGAAHCPAYRGIAYAVFEDMDLSPYGNRIPSFSFELLDDAGVDRTMADVVADVVGDRIGPVHAAPGAPGLTGYAVDGPTRRDALEPLADILPIDAWADPADGQTRWRVGDDGTAPVATLPAIAADQGRARAEWRRGAADAVPARICVGGYDPARDYQIGTQSEQVPGGRGADQRIAMPIAISADDGKALAAYLATRRAVAGEQLVWPTGFAALALAPGARVNTAVDGPAYRVAER
ncbi:MAG: phage tail protein, partial [Sphingopyxis sp.]